MVFRVEYTSEAEADLNGILDWLISRSAGDSGLRWFEGLEQAIASVQQWPERCPLATKSGGFPSEVRHLFYGRKPHLYRVIFTIEADTVLILHIRHGRRQPLQLP